MTLTSLSSNSGRKMQSTLQLPIKVLLFPSGHSNDCNCRFVLLAHPLEVSVFCGINSITSVIPMDTFRVMRSGWKYGVQPSLFSDLPRMNLSTGTVITFIQISKRCSNILLEGATILKSGVNEIDWSSNSALDFGWPFYLLWCWKLRYVNDCGHWRWVFERRNRKSYQCTSLVLPCCALILGKDVFFRNLSIIVIADWYNLPSLRKLKFFDENTRQWWDPLTGWVSVARLCSLS